MFLPTLDASPTTMSEIWTRDQNHMDMCLQPVMRLVKITDISLCNKVDHVYVETHMQLRVNMSKNMILNVIDLEAKELR